MNALFSSHRKGVMPTEVSEIMKKSINMVSRQLNVLKIHRRNS